MNVYEKLSEQGINLRSNRQGDQRMVCPKCHGGRSKEHSLSVTVRPDEAVWLCHRGQCGWTGGVHTEDHRSDDYQPQRRYRPEPVRPTYTPKVETASEAVEKWFAGRGISRATMDANHISVTKVWMPGVDAEVSCIAFPYFRDGELINVKYRDGQKHFRQEKGAEKILFGMDNVPKDADTLIWVEGEADAMACNEAGLWNVVSVPDGAPKQVREDQPDPEDDTKFEYVWNCHEFLARFKRHILAVDNDAPGRALEEELARRLGKEICWRVEWPEATGDVHCKDANDTLMHCGKDGVLMAVNRAKGYPVKDLHEVASFEEDIIRLYREGRKRGLSTGFSNIDKLYSVRPGEFCVVTGYPSSGKSEWVDAVAVNMAMMHGWKFAVCSFENPPDEHAAKWAEKYLAKPFTEGPTPRMTEEELRRAIVWVDRHFVTIRHGDDSPTIDWVLEKARIAVMRYGIKGLILDPYNEFEHIRRDSQTETLYVSDMLSKVKRFAQGHGVHVWFIAHPSKPQKDKQNDEPSLYDISGSSHWVNKADIGISVHRGWDSDGSRSSVAEVHVKKVRFRAVGQPGIAKLEFIPATGRYIEYN